ncbi:MAG: hypothetical protein HYX69_16080 [Planctomycetia bacterium]|nr:hypothetical protein [Planctomycetia bacterium]
MATDDTDDVRPFPWLELLLVTTAAALVFQLFPRVWWGLLSTIDVRTWTWRTYAVICGLAIVALAGAKAWQNR